MESESESARPGRQMPSVGRPAARARGPRWEPGMGMIPHPRQVGDGTPTGIPIGDGTPIPIRDPDKSGMGTGMGIGVSAP